MTTARCAVCGTIFGAALCSTSVAGAADYYVDSVAGNDSNNGSSEATPFKSLSKLPRTGAGDVVNLKSGSGWEISSGISVSGATYQRYGSGELPVITSTGSGYGVISVQGNATIDGLKVRSTGKAATGISVNGSKNVIRNCDVDGSDGVLQLGFGVMGTGNLITQNHVHDLTAMTGDSGDMNTSGGSEAYMIMGSDNEISYNSAVRCAGINETLNGFEGGCLEIVNPKAGSTISGVKFHHNYCEASVGLFEGCSGNFQGTDKIQENHGKIEDVEVSYNISVDSMWLYLLQPVNTDFKNVSFSNNTLIHTEKTWTLWSRNDAFAMVVAKDSPPGGQTYTVPADFAAGTISVRNNIFVDAVTGHTQYGFFGSNVADHGSNIFVPANARLGSLTKNESEQLLALSDLAFTTDFRLGPGSKAIDKGVVVGFSEDIDHHPVPCGAAPDVGASEYCEGSAGRTGSGGATNATGGTGPSSGGSRSASGSGGATNPVPSTGGAGNQSSRGGNAGNLPVATGGIMDPGPGTGGGGAPIPIAGGGSGSNDTTGGTGSQPVGSGGSASGAPASESGCGCRTGAGRVHGASLTSVAVCILGLLRLRRRSQR